MNKKTLLATEWTSGLSVDVAHSGSAARPFSKVLAEFTILSTRLLCHTLNCIKSTVTPLRSFYFAYAQYFKKDNSYVLPKQ